MRFAHLLLSLLLAAGSLPAEKLDPAKWSLELRFASAPPGSKLIAKLQAGIEPGWHLYSLTTPAGGPIRTTIRLADNAALQSYRVFEPKPKRALDPNFNLETETYEGQPVFLIELETSKGAAPGTSEIKAEVRYQMCNDRLCLPPVRRSATAPLSIDPK